MNSLQKQIQEDPILFFDNILGAEHWSMQDKIIESVFKNQRTTVKSCHGIGKSYITARILLAFLTAYEDSIVVTTAPTFRQVENIIWREVRQAIKKAKIPIGGNILKTKLDIDEKRYAIGLSSDKEDNFQGFHAVHLLVIADEAGGIIDSTLSVMEALMTSQGTKLLYIGNPTQSSGGFYNSHQSQLFNKISVSCFDTPNFKFNKIKDINDLLSYSREELIKLPLPYPELVTPLWALERTMDRGIETGMFMSRVLGEFPDEGEDTLIRTTRIESALIKEFPEEERRTRNRRRCIGIDVARFGDDTTVFVGMDNLKMDKNFKFHRGKDLMKTTGMAIAYFNELGYDKQFEYFIVDDTGLGGGVTDRLMELGYNVLPINNASSPNDKETFRDLKAEMYWSLRQSFISGKIKIYDRERVVGDLASLKIDYTSQGQIFIVGKKEMKKQGLKSPDFADAICLAHYGCTMIDGGDITIEDEEDETICGNLYNKSF